MACWASCSTPTSSIAFATRRNSRPAIRGGRAMPTPVDIRQESRSCRHSTRAMPDYKSELLQGTLDLLVLRTLAANDAMHGWGISQRIAQRSRDVLTVNQGSLYPALHRLEAQG